MCISINSLNLASHATACLDKNCEIAWAPVCLVETKLLHSNFFKKST